MSARPWQASTALLAATTAVLLILLVRQPEPPGGEPRGRRSASPLPAVPVSDSAPAPEEPEPEMSPGAPAPVLRPVHPAKAAARLVVFPGETVSERAYREVVAAGSEVVPRLESWIRRPEEIRRAGGSLRWVYEAYADILGRDAVPLLEEILVPASPGRLLGPGGPDAFRARLREVLDR